MAAMSYRDLNVWSFAIDLVAQCYELSKLFPRDQQYSLVQQLQRSAVSVPANIAEGHGRSHTKEFLNHLSIAHGSLMELETHLVIAHRVGYLDNEVLAKVLDQTNRLGRMINALKTSLRTRLAHNRGNAPSPIPNPRSPITT